MPLKIMGALLLAAAGLSGGFLRARGLYLRRSFFRRFGAFLSSLSTAVRYSGEDIFTLVFSSGELFELKEKPSSASFEQAWNSATEELPRRWCLSAQDMELLQGFGARLGATDAQGQLDHIELYREAAARRLSEAEEDVSQKARLYKTLGLFAGALAGIFFL